MSTKVAEIDKELEEILTLVSSPQRDPEALQRAREMADEIRREMRAKYGHRNLAAELVRQARGE